MRTTVRSPSHLVVRVLESNSSTVLSLCFKCL